MDLSFRTQNCFHKGFDFLLDILVVFVNRDLFRMRCFSKSCRTNSSTAVHLMSSDSASLVPASFFRASYLRMRSSNCSNAGRTPSQDLVLSGFKIAIRTFLLRPAVTGCHRRLSRRHASNPEPVKLLHPTTKSSPSPIVRDDNTRNNWSALSSKFSTSSFPSKFPGPYTFHNNIRHFNRIVLVQTAA